MAHPGEVGTLVVSSGALGRAVQEIVKTARAKKVRVERRPPAELERISGTPRHQGVAAVMASEFNYRAVEDLIEIWKASAGPALFVILDSVQDPRNLGSLARTAYAAGAHGLLIPKDRAAAVTPAAVKASAGAIEHIAIARETNLVRAIEKLKANGVWVVGLEADASEDIYSAELEGDLAVVIGGEGSGIRRLVREACDFTVSIPMAGGFNSLNAAQAGAVTLFEIRRRRLAGS
jgi:23S rRNA (guanosine2251-2'-O)-methyltransferase